MSLTLELSPTQENELQTAARREGMPVTDYAQRLFVAALRERVATLENGTATNGQGEPAWKARLRASQERVERARLTNGITEEEIEADIDAAIRSYRQERAAQELKP